MANDEIVVVDGANVAWEETSADGDPKVSNIVSMRRRLEQSGYDPIVIVDASLHHEIDDAEQLESLIDQQKVRQAPASTDADSFVLKVADEEQARIVSNDLFDSYRSRYPWIEERRLPFMVIRGEVFLGSKPSQD